MARKTVAQLLVEPLVLAGVKRIFGVAGDSLKWDHRRHRGNVIIDLAKTNLFR